MSNKEIYLIGVGNYTEVIIELAQDCGYVVKGLYHYNKDRTGEEVMNIPIIGWTDDLYATDIKEKNFAVTIGDNTLRNQIATKLRSLGGITPNLIHPKAYVSASAELGVGCFIHIGATISTRSIAGNDCIIGITSLVAHHVVLGEACSVSTSSVVGTYCVIGKRVFFGINSLILPFGLTLGDDCVVGGKANVTKSFPSNCLLVGNPARKVKEINK